MVDAMDMVREGPVLMVGLIEFIVMVLPVKAEELEMV